MSCHAWKNLPLVAWDMASLGTTKITEMATGYKGQDNSLGPLL